MSDVKLHCAKCGHEQTDWGRCRQCGSSIKLQIITDLTTGAGCAGFSLQLLLADPGRYHVILYLLMAAAGLYVFFRGAGNLLTAWRLRRGPS